MAKKKAVKKKKVVKKVKVFTMEDIRIRDIYEVKKGEGGGSFDAWGNAVYIEVTGFTFSSGTKYLEYNILNKNKVLLSTDYMSVGPANLAIRVRRAPKRVVKYVTAAEVYFSKKEMLAKLKGGEEAYEVGKKFEVVSKLQLKEMK